MFRLVVSGLLAILCHGVVVLLLGLSGAFENFGPTSLSLVQNADAARKNEPDEPLQVESLVEELTRPPTLTEAEKKQKAEEERKDAHGQVVDIAKPAIEQRPEDARFLSEYDSKVAHETKSAVGKGQAGAPQKAEMSPPPQIVPPQLTPPGGPKGPALAMRSPLGTKVPGPTGAPTDVESIGPDGNLAHQAGAGPVRPPEAPGGAALPGSGTQPILIPSPKMMQQALGMGAGSPDYLDDMDDASSTGLNAKKWMFAAFFNRIKRAVADEWHPDELLSRHDPSGHIYGANDRTTVLKVQLRPDGRIEDLKVSKSSGVDFLDDEATSAFRRAQPFENPPTELVDKDGYIRFNFGFIVQLSGRTSFKFYKYKD